MVQIDPFKFLQEVRAEAQKVTWPTRKETTVTTMMVFVMVILATIFFLVADQIMRLGIGYCSASTLRPMSPARASNLGEHEPA
jgi:preprotein translocase subunit SecE